MARSKKSSKRGKATKVKSAAAGAAAKKSSAKSTSGAAQFSQKKQPFAGAKSSAAFLGAGAGGRNGGFNPWAAFSNPESLMKGFWPNGSGDASKAQDRIMSFGKSGAQSATRSLNEAMQIGQESIEVYVECGSIAADMSRTISDEVVSYANNLMAQNAELSRDAMSCRTINDVFDLQSKALRSNLDEFFHESARLSELMFEMASRLSEPLSEHVAGATERLSKTVAA